MFKKPVWDDLSFVTWCIILLEVHQKMVHCSHKGMDMDNNTQVDWRLNDSQLVLKDPTCAKKISPPHHYTTSTSSLNRWDKAGWSMLSCSLHQILTLHLNAAEIKTHQTRQRFPIFYCPVLVILCELYPPCAVLIWPERHPVWSSAAGVHLLQGSMCCVFRDGILQILVVTSGYLSYCCLSIISNQSVHSPLTWKTFSSTQLPLTGYFLFFNHSL